MSEQPGKIGRGTQRPFAGDAHQIDAAGFVFFLQLRQQRMHVGTFRQALRQNLLVERGLRGKQQRFKNAQLFGALLLLRVVDHYPHLRRLWHAILFSLTHSPFRRPSRLLPDSHAYARKLVQMPCADSLQAGLHAPAQALRQRSKPIRWRAMPARPDTRRDIDRADTTRATCRSAAPALRALRRATTLCASASAQTPAIEFAAVRHKPTADRKE